MVDVVSLVEQYRKLKSSEERKQLLQYNYPPVYISVLKHLKKTREVQSYMLACQSHRMSDQKYSIYVHGFVEPKLQEQRENNELRHGK